MQRTTSAVQPGLVAGAHAAAGVAVEVLVKQDQVLPVRIVGEAGVAAVAGAPPVRRRRKRRASRARELARPPPAG